MHLAPASSVSPVYAHKPPMSPHFSLCGCDLLCPTLHTPITSPWPCHYSCFFLSSQEGNPMTALTPQLKCHPGCSQLSSWKGRSEVPWTYDHNSCHGKRPGLPSKHQATVHQPLLPKRSAPPFPFPSNPLSLSLPSFSTFKKYIYLLSVHTVPSPSQIPISFCNQMD